MRLFNTLPGDKVKCLVVMKAQMMVIQKDYCSVESLALRKVQTTVLTKAASLVVMKAQMMVIRKECYSVVKKVQLIKLDSPSMMAR